MTLELLDWDGNATEFEIGNIDTIASISIVVISGDEIANVIYKDYTMKQFDSSDCRSTDYYDAEYEIYRYDKKDNIIDKEEFKNRQNSYICFKYIYES